MTWVPTPDISFVAWLYYSWAERNHELLDEINSTLEFSLTRMNFLMILNSRTKESRMDALYYSKSFQKFAAKHSRGLYPIKLIEWIEDHKTWPCFVNPIRSLVVDSFAIFLFSSTIL